jgi:hypothetical protein
VPYQHRILAAVRQNEAKDVQVVVQDETNTNFLGRYTPAAYRVTVSLRQNVPADTQRFETNPHFIGRYTAGTYRIAVWLRQNPAVADQPETQPHFLGKFKGGPHKTLALLRQNVDTTSRQAFTAEAQPHFIGRYVRAQHILLPGFRQTVPNDIQIGYGNEPHFLGRFTATRYEILPWLRQNPDVRVFVPTSPAWVFPQAEAIYAAKVQISTAYEGMPSVVEAWDVLSSHSPNPIERD